MTDLSQGASELDARLAEIDRKLRAIQVGLDPEREPTPNRPSPPAKESSEVPPPEPLPKVARDHPASGHTVPPDVHAKLVSAMRDLLDAYGWTLQQLPVPAAPHPGGGDPPVAMSVGPFANSAALRRFEYELLRLPGVREVTLRGYEGENRVMFEVRLSEPTA